MTSALIGHTGFVGSNLAQQRRFDEYYNSKNIDDIVGRSFDEVVCAGAPGAKWYANEHPEEDWASICRLIKALYATKIERLVLISTVDAIAEETAYGRHRARLETQCGAATIVRLPALFGAGLRKNALYDLMAGQRLDEIAPNAVYQWYPLRRLADDLAAVAALGLIRANLVSEPIAMEEIRARFFPKLQIGRCRIDAAAYFIEAKSRLSKTSIFEEMMYFLAGCSDGNARSLQ